MTIQRLRDLHWEWNAYLKTLEDKPRTPDVESKIEVANRVITALRTRAAAIREAQS